jgi:hypothetical protein
MLSSRKVVVVLAIAALLVAAPAALPITDVVVLIADATVAPLFRDSRSVEIEPSSLQALPSLRAPPLA